jgi:hypothetical protein
MLVKYNQHTKKSDIFSVWRNILALHQLGQTGSSVSIDNGKSVEFWIDRWAGEYAFMSYYHLYRLCTDPHISVYEVIMSEGHVLTFKRTLTCILLLDFNELCNLIRQIILIDRSDQLLWRASPSDSFSTHNVYEWLMFRGITNASTDLW